MACLRVMILLLFAVELACADVGVICTLPGELKAILDLSRTERIVRIAHREFHCGWMEGRKMVVVRSPMGKVNNAISAQILVSRFDVEGIISIGFAGGVDPSIRIGDVVVSTRALQHDFGSIRRYGFVWGKSPEIGGPSAAGTRADWAASKGYRVGPIATGDQFVASEKKREWLGEKFGAGVVDMGAAAVQEVGNQNGIPCVFIRTVSDLAGIEGGIEFDRSAQTKTFRSVEALRCILREQPFCGRGR